VLIERRQNVALNDTMSVRNASHNASHDWMKPESHADSTVTVHLSAVKRDTCSRQLSIMTNLRRQGVMTARSIIAGDTRL